MDRIEGTQTVGSVGHTLVNINDTDTLKSALWYAEQGLYIFPCRGSSETDWKVAKKPHTMHGFKDASNDPNQIAEWWSKWPDAFIGLATGAINNLTVIDVDGTEDKEFVGLLMNYAKNMECPIIKTSRGHHVYFSYHPGLPNRVGILPGIDIRNAGGYVIAPPSSHTPTGNSYELINSRVEFPAACCVLCLDE